MFSIPDITPSHLQHDIIGARIIQNYKNLKSENSSTDGYMVLLLDYARSIFGDFESYLRIVVGLAEDDIQLILKQYNSKYVTHKITLEVYSNKDISEAVYKMGDHEGTLQIEYDDISAKTKPILTHLGSTLER